MARPREWDRAELVEALDRYVEDTEIPILAEFSYKHGVARTYLYDLPELADAIKRCIAKKEYALEALALRGQVNCTMAIFSLKQLGWKDTHETTNKFDGPVPFQILPTDVPPNAKAT
jgi:hypothetical protein